MNPPAKAGRGRMGQKRKQSSRLQPFFKNSRRHGKVSEAPPAKQGKKHAPTAAAGGGHWRGDMGRAKRPQPPGDRHSFFKISLGGAGGLSWQERLPAQPPAPHKARKKHAPTAAAGVGHWWGDPWGGLNAPNLPATAIPFLRFLGRVREGLLGKKALPLTPPRIPLSPTHPPRARIIKRNEPERRRVPFVLCDWGETGTYSRSAIS